MAAATVGAGVGSREVAHDAPQAPHASQEERISRLVINALKDRTRSESLKDELSGLDLESLNSLFERVSEAIVEMEDPLEATKGMEGLFTLDQVKAAANELLEAHGSALDLADDLVGSAEFFFKHTASENSKIQLSHLFQKGLIALGNIIVALGVRDLFHQSDGAFDIYFKIQKFFLVIQAYQLFYSFAVALWGAQIGAIVIGTLFILITALSMVYPLISPFPQNLINEVQNWTYKAECGLLSKVEGHAIERNEIADRLKLGANVLVVGESGVGKTRVVQGFVHDVLDGKHPELEGKCFFYVNAARLIRSCSDSNASQVWDRILEQMGRHREDIVLIVDEFHQLFKPNALGIESSLGAQLLTMIERETGEFRNFIAITTDLGLKIIKGEKIPQIKTESRANVYWNDSRSHQYGDVTTWGAYNSQEGSSHSHTSQKEEKGQVDQATGLKELNSGNDEQLRSFAGEIDLPHDSLHGVLPNSQERSSYPHTPQEGMEELVEPVEPILRRFKEPAIWIESATEQDVLTILSAHIYGSHPEVACTKEVLRYLVKKVAEQRVGLNGSHPQQIKNDKLAKEPYASLAVLEEALAMLSISNSSKLEDDVEKLRQKLYACDAINSLDFSGASSDSEEGSASDSEEGVDSLNAICADLYARYYSAEEVQLNGAQTDQRMKKPRQLLRELSNRVKSQREKAVILHKEMDRFLDMRRECYHCAQKVAEISAEQIPAEKHGIVKRLILLRGFVNKKMHNHLRKKGGKLGLHSVLDEELVGLALNRVVRTPPSSPKAALPVVLMR